MAKQGYKRSTRVADQIRMEIADILMRKTKDPRVGGVTVTDVKCTSDLRLARVFIAVRGDENEEKLALHGLEKAAGFIRSELGRRLQLRYTPDLVFQHDRTVAQGNRILSLIEEAMDRDDKKEA